MKIARTAPAVLLLAAAGLLAACSSGTSVSAPSETPNGAVTSSVSPGEYTGMLPDGVSSSGSNALAAAQGSGGKVLEMWEDFQCPDCKALESSPAWAMIEELADSGQLTIAHHPTSFLDQRLGNDSSALAAAAYGCAIDQKAGESMHRQLFENQPPEGRGWSMQALMRTAEQARVPALSAFGDCVDSGRYQGWAPADTHLFYARGYQHVPWLVLDGQAIGWDELADVARLKAKLTGQ